MRYPCPRLNPAPISFAIALALAAPGFVQAQTADNGKVVSLSISTQSLGSALNELSAETGIPIAFSPALVAGKTAPAVNGSLTMRQALGQLLAGSGLTASVDRGTFIIKQSPPTQEQTLPAVTVRASTSPENAYGPVLGYVAKRSATGTKTDAPLVEIPQSISLIGSEQIEVTKSQSLTDALEYTAGVNRLEGADRTTDSLMLRGFQAFADYGNFFRDGTKYGVNSYNGQIEPYGLERVEFLKGASSVLYGTVAPGGVINTVTKRPTDEPLRELSLEAGSFNRKQLSGDFSNKFSPESDWSYRLTFLGRESDTFVDYAKDDRLYIAPAIKWQPSAQTSLTLLGEFQRDRTHYIYGLPPEGTILPNMNGRISRNLFVGEKSDTTDHNDVDRKSLGYLFEHSFDDNTKLRNSLRYMTGKTERGFTWIWGLTPDQRSPLSRVASGVAEDYSQVTSDTSLQHKWTSGSVENTTFVGLDYAYQDYKKGQWDRDIAGSFDLFNPTYGHAISDLYGYRYQHDKSNRVGLYAQNQAKINDRWVVLAGARQDWSRASNLAFFRTEATKERTDALTGRLGLVYLGDNGLAPYVSFSQSFEPTIGSDRAGNKFKPTEGEQYEAGVRYQPPGKDLLLTAAIYQLTRTNVSVTDPVDTNFSVQQGEVRSRGLELEARTSIGRNANLIAAYAYTDARTLKSSALTPELEGKRTGAVPYHQFSVWTDYDFGAFGIPGLKAGIGARYVGSTTALYIDGAVPAYTVFDAMVSYKTGPWQFALNIKNLADKYYVASCTYYCFYGEPRKVIGTATYRW